MLERGVQAFLGTVETAYRGLAVRAADQRLGLQCAVTENPVEARAGDWVIARVLKYPKDSQQGEARIEQRLDPERPVQMATEAAIARFGLPVDFPAAALREAAHWGKQVDPKEAAQRVDLRGLPLVTIDGADAKDFDDAVYAERLEGGGFRLLVAIADVSHYVRPGSALDTEARARGTSVYFPTRVLPMLPTALSNHLCSLEPQVDRLCMVADMRISKRGALEDSKFYPAVMRSAARLTYNQAHDALFLGVPAARRARAGARIAAAAGGCLSRAAGRAPQARRARVRCTGSRIRDRERRAGAGDRIRVAQRCAQADRRMHGAGQCRGGAGAAHAPAAGAVSRSRPAG